jgi:hypothetical protein
MTEVTESLEPRREFTQSMDVQWLEWAAMTWVLYGFLIPPPNSRQNAKDRLFLWRSCAVTRNSLSLDSHIRFRDPDGIWWCVPRPWVKLEHSSPWAIKTEASSKDHLILDILPSSRSPNPKELTFVGFIEIPMRFRPQLIFEVISAETHHDGIIRTPCNVRSLMIWIVMTGLCISDVSLQTMRTWTIAQRV